MCAVYILTQNKNIVKKIRLVTAMHRNGPLPQVDYDSFNRSVQMEFFN